MTRSGENCLLLRFSHSYTEDVFSKFPSVHGSIIQGGGTYECCLSEFLYSFFGNIVAPFNFLGNCVIECPPCLIVSGCYKSYPVEMWYFL